VRLRIDLSYDGTDFHGWAKQPSLRTVEGTLEGALTRILRMESVSLTCAGRTDAGVHARDQVVHLDLDRATLGGIVRSSAVVPGDARVDAPVDALVRRLNGLLPHDVHIRRAAEAAEGFDARFSAIWRRYAYRIADAPRLVDPLRRREVLARPRRLDLVAMNDAAAMLLGEHDFAAFCRRRSGATTIRSLLELRWDRDEQGLAVATVKADAFCHSMVRSLVGCLLEVGEHRQEPGWSRTVLLAGTRNPAVRVARPHGLTLEQVAYPPDAELAAQAVTARVVRTLPAGEDADG